MTQPFVSIIVPITRRWALPKVFKNLDMLYCDLNKTELLFYVDTPDPFILNDCNKYLRGSKYRRHAMIKSGNTRPTDVSVAVRRARIVESKERVKPYLAKESEYVFGVEDDTGFRRMSLNRLLDPITALPDVGFVQGVQAGRWDTKIIGAWRANDVSNPTMMETVAFEPKWPDGRDKYLENIDGGGFYCYITRTELFKKAEYRSDGLCLGPDVTYGLDLKKQGLKCLMDWGLICEHFTEDQTILPGSDCQQLVYNKIGGQWEKEL